MSFKDSLLPALLVMVGFLLGMLAGGVGEDSLPEIPVRYRHADETDPVWVCKEVHEVLECEGFEHFMLRLFERQSEQEQKSL